MALDHTRSWEGKDITEGLDVQIPDTRASLRMLENLIKAKQAREKVEADRQARRELAATAAAAAAPAFPPDNAALAELEAMQQSVDLSSQGEDFLEGEQCLFKVRPQEPQLQLDEAFTTATLQASVALGLTELVAALDAEEQDGASGDAPEPFQVAAFKQSVLSGVLRTAAVRQGGCSVTTARALFALLAHSPDGELAGAAFTTLLALMGDPALPQLALESVHAAPPAAGRAVQLQWVPTLSDVLAALKTNGYDAQRAAADAEKQRHAAAAAAEDAANEEAEEEEERVQAVKFLLHVGAAACRYCGTHPSAAPAVLTPDAVAELLVAVVQLGLDPAGLRLHGDLEVAADALLGVLHEDDWARKLPAVAERVAGLRPGPRACLRALRQLQPAAGGGRGLQLQQFAGCLLLQRCLPGQQAATSAGRRRGQVPHPATVLQALPWFSAPKRLVSDAAPTDGPASHSIADVELLLRLCDLLLWPHALHSWRIGGPASRADSDDEEDGGAGALAPAFVDAWLQFLGGIHRSIKALLPEDQAVKALANQLEITYREMAAGPKAGMSHLASP